MSQSPAPRQFKKNTAYTVNLVQYELMARPLGNIGLRLKELREQSGYSVRVLADLIGMPASTYANYEKRFKQKYLPIELVERLAPIFQPKGISRAEVLTLGGVTDALLPLHDIYRQAEINAARDGIGFEEAATQLIENAPAYRPIDPLNRSSEFKPEPDYDFNASPNPDAPPLPHPASMAKDIKVLGTAECGPNGTFELNTGDVIDFVRRPPGLIGNRTVFAIYANGDSMEPMFWPGDLVYVDPKRPPMPGRAVVVEMHPPHEQEHPRALLKILVRRNGDSVELRQLNPDKPTTVPNSKIKGIYRVLTLAELMGI